MTETVQIKQQLIRSLIQNLQWEIDPKCKQQLYTIGNEIYEYWTNYKGHHYNSVTKEFERDQ